MDEQNEELELNKLMQVRKDKLKELQEAGKDPFQITKYDRTEFSGQIKENYENFENKDVSVAGRIMAKRIMGKASFCTIQDSTGPYHSHVTVHDLGDESYKAFKTYDIGDMIGIKGFVFKTKTGEVSIHAKEVVLLAKSLRDLPEKFHGLKDTDLRYRQRYVDLIVNPEVKNTFEMRSKIIKEIRNFYDNKNYMEVETPSLSTIAGGANAKPFETYHNALGLDMYLRIAPELYLKRLIVGGFDRVYEIGKSFRNEGIDIRHNPEFTSMESYAAYQDYNEIMDLVEEMFRSIAEKLLGKTKITYQGKEIDLGAPWKRITMIDAIKEVTGVDFNTINSDEEALNIAKEKGVEIQPSKQTRGYVISEFFESFVEETLIQPTFICEYPIEVSPLAKKKPSDGRVTERFEFFIDAHEYGNGYSELNDPIDQYERFLAQVKQREAGDDEANMMDDDFVRALEYGMPPTGGLGIGVDRMVMLFTDSVSIRDVLLFPTMKPLKTEKVTAKQVAKEVETLEKSCEKTEGIAREKALDILKKYNKEEFHIRHALTVEGVMKYFAKEQKEDEEYWGNIGLLHDVDFEMYPDEHCQKCVELLKQEHVSDGIIRSICSHGYGICSDIEPKHMMEKILFATDELTGLIWAAAKMRPSKSVQDMEVSSLKKKFKDKKFASGCSREIIQQGAQMLGWELEELFEKTILAMRENEEEINRQMQEK